MQEEVKIIEEHHVHAKEMVFQIAEIETDNRRIFVLLINGRESLVAKDLSLAHYKLRSILSIFN